MAKPIIFFSHSSRDGEALAFLKQRFIELTHSTIDVFLSSDGQSVQLGRNWVSSIENALDKASLMFVFVTPNSLRSPWLYFETGHAYSKKIDVVPVGLFGVDIGKVPAPLSILQGFNVFGHDALNNLITMANKAFDAAHPLGFTEDDFRTFIDVGPVETVRMLGDHWGAIEFLQLTASKKAPAAQWPIPAAYDEISGSKVVEGLDCSIPGAVFKLVGDSIDLPDTPPPDYSFQAELDPALAHIALPIVEPVFQKLTQRVDGRLGYKLRVAFRPGAGAFRQPHIVMSRLFGTKVRLPDETSKLCRFGDLAFYIDHSFANTNEPLVRPDLNVTSSGRSFAEADIGGLINLLFERSVMSY